jgi:hypothetical protein
LQSSISDEERSNEPERNKKKKKRDRVKGKRPVVRREIHRKPEWEQIEDRKRQMRVVGSSHLNTTWGSLKGGTPRGIECDLSVRFLSQLKPKIIDNCGEEGYDLISLIHRHQSEQIKENMYREGDGAGSIIQNKGKNGDGRGRKNKRPIGEE